VGKTLARLADRRGRKDEALQNLIAQGALIVWPLVALVLFMSMSAGRATVWTLLAGYLLLPERVAFDFPGVPALDKSTIPNLTALVLGFATARPGEFRWPRSKTLNLLMAAFVLTAFASAFTNGAPVVIGSTTLPGLGFREGLANAVGHVLMITPFLLGAALLGNEKGHRHILMALVIGALAYAAPMLLEIRLSPFFQVWVYGITDVEFFLQQIRFGGFRSMMFLGHGLLVSAFCAMALLAAIGLARMRVKLFGVPMSLVAAFLAALLLLNKSVGAVVLVVLLAPMLLFLRPRFYIVLMAGLAMVVVAYPAVRGMSLMPFQEVVQAIETISPQRAHSLDTRLRNEEMLLARASEKPLFGWGSHGRNRVIVVTSWGATMDISITDGTWIIVIGTVGWVGYVLYFGLLSYPFWHALRLRKAVLPMASLTLLAVHMFNVLDLIPNSSVRPLTWLIAGALANMAFARLRAPGRSAVARRPGSAVPRSLPAVPRVESIRS